MSCEHVRADIRRISQLVVVKLSVHAGPGVHTSFIKEKNTLSVNNSGQGLSKALLWTFPPCGRECSAYFALRHVYIFYHACAPVFSKEK